MGPKTVHDATKLNELQAPHHQQTEIRKQHPHRDGPLCDIKMALGSESFAKGVVHASGVLCRFSGIQ